MNGHRGHLLAAFGLMLAVALVLFDLLPSLASIGPWISASYAGVLVLLTAYACYLKYDLSALREKMATCRQAWRTIPGSIAMVKRNQSTEVCADGGLFHIFGMACRDREGGNIPPDLEPGKLIRREETREKDGKIFHADRFIVPVKGSSDDYFIEFLLDASERVNKLRQRESEYVQMLKILVNMFEIKDPYSHGHSEIVSHLTHELAKALGLPEAERNKITKAALLHDIGKIIIPPEVLGKSEKLTAAEREQIQTHPNVGADILSGMDLFRDESVIVRHHHERFDGRGYPAGLAGGDIPLGSRIIAVVDAFDAMTMGRLAQGRHDVATTLSILESEKGRQFDPEIVRVFITMVRNERDEKI